MSTTQFDCLSSAYIKTEQLQMFVRSELGKKPNQQKIDESA